MRHAALLQRFFLLTFVAWLVALTRPVQAAGDRRSLEQAVHGPSADQCPLPSAVASETWKLTPADRRDVFEKLTDVVIEDLGSSYRVTVTMPDGTTTRTYPGPDRDCARRARFAAALVILSRVAGTNLAYAASDSGLELGAEISVTAAWRAGTLLQPFIGLETQWIPTPRALIALPRGDLGTLPPLWLGASAGVALNLRKS